MTERLIFARQSIVLTHVEQRILVGWRIEMPWRKSFVGQEAGI